MALLNDELLKIVRINYQYHFIGIVQHFHTFLRALCLDFHFRSQECAKLMLIFTFIIINFVLKPLMCKNKSLARVNDQLSLSHLRQGSDAD